MSFQLAQKTDSRNAATQVSCTRFSWLIKNDGIKLEKNRLNANSFEESGFVGQNIFILYLGPPFVLDFQADS